MAFFIGVAPSNRGCANGNPRTYDRHDLTPLNLRLKVLNQLFICHGGESSARQFDHSKRLSGPAFALERHN